MKTKVQVKDLRKGDQLSTGTVVSDPFQLIQHGITSGSKPKMFLEMESAGVCKGKVWGKNTTVTVTNR